MTNTDKSKQLIYVIQNISDHLKLLASENTSSELQQDGDELKCLKEKIEKYAKEIDETVKKIEVNTANDSDEASTIISSQNSDSPLKVT